MKKRWYLLHIGVTLLLFLGWRSWSRRPESKPPVQSRKDASPAIPLPAPVNNDPLSPERLVALGERVIFGVNAPKFDPGKDPPIGRGQCPACHIILEGQRPTRFPRLIGVIARAADRINDARYKKSVQTYAQAGEPKSGIRPHAKTAGEYLIESIYCPDCYVVEGFGLPETGDTISPMPIINRPEVGLNDYEMAAIVAYLQAIEAKGDLAKVTAKQDWENYFGKKLTAVDARETTMPSAPPRGDISKVGLAEETPEAVIEKMACFACHKIPTVPIAQVGKIGPPLILKTTAAKRIASPEYQKALKEGKVRATTPKEYVMESILNPSGFIVPGFDDAMPKNFKTKLTFGAVERLADFLLTLDETSGKDEEAQPSPGGGKSAVKGKE